MKNIPNIYNVRPIMGGSERIVEEAVEKFENHFTQVEECVYGYTDSSKNKYIFDVSDYCKDVVKYLNKLGFKKYSKKVKTKTRYEIDLDDLVKLVKKLRGEYYGVYDY